MSFSETIVLFVLALLLFGPKKLPEIARQIGKMLNEFRRASNEFRSQIESEISQIDAENTRRPILPPSEPPVGAISALPLSPQPALPSVSPTEPTTDGGAASHLELSPVSSASKATDV
jgi:sec-independent protein translocase protein TatB